MKTHSQKFAISVFPLSLSLSLVQHPTPNSRCPSLSLSLALHLSLYLFVFSGEWEGESFHSLSLSLSSSLSFCFLCCIFELLCINVCRCVLYFTATGLLCRHSFSAYRMSVHDLPYAFHFPSRFTCTHNDDDNNNNNRVCAGASTTLCPHNPFDEKNETSKEEKSGFFFVCRSWVVLCPI